MQTDNLSSESVICVSNARRTVSEKRDIKESEIIMLMEEQLFHGDRPVIHQKLYFLPAYYELKLMRRNDRYTTK